MFQDRGFFGIYIHRPFIAWPKCPNRFFIFQNTFTFEKKLLAFTKNLSLENWLSVFFKTRSNFFANFLDATHNF